MLKVQQIPERFESGQTIEPRSTVYTATLNAQEANIYNCRVSAYPFNRRWPGYQRPLAQTQIAGMLSFVSDEKVEVEITFLTKTPQSVCIRPLSANIQPVLTGNKVTFTLEKVGAYCLETDNQMTDVLQIFYNPPMEAVKESEVDLYFGPGSHHPGIMKVQSGQRIYVDMDAIVYGSFQLENVENVEIFGYGILDDAFESRYGFLPGNGGYFRYVGNIRMTNCKNITVRGVTLRDSVAYILHTYSCDGIQVENVKAVGQWKYNTDGFDFHNTSNVLVDGCFLRTFDDTICMKGNPNYDMDTRNVIIRNCVLWNDWGKTLEIGYDSSCFHIENILFENCDLIHNTSGALSINNGGGALVENIRYKDIRIEFSDCEKAILIQETDDQAFPNTDIPAYQAIVIHNSPLWESGYAVEGAKIPEKFRGYNGLCKVRNVRFDNISILTLGAEKSVILQAVNSGKEGDFSDIHFSNITLNGRKLTAEDFQQLDGAVVE